VDLNTVASRPQTNCPLPAGTPATSVSPPVTTIFPNLRGLFRFTKLPACAAGARPGTERRRRRSGCGPAVLLAGALLLPCVQASPAWSRDRILLVGNSFSRGLKSPLRSLARSALRDVTVSVSARSGFTLELHSASRSSLRRLRGGEWHSVVLQEQSDGIDEERYPFARMLDGEIEALGARTVFFMTWADHEDPLEDFDKLRGVPGGSEGYVPIAFELDAALAPVGWVFRELLAVEPGADLWDSDGHHASERGRYLAAITIYAVVFDESPVGLWASPKLAPEQVLADQQLVESVVLGHPADWNLDAP
jgi:hypothetical protein